ncbi:hypothetical protein, partial [Stenotrophomonas pavanii]|uniref:hypothetical protein n=1 Tax=Stenotrophomonas pavanii TaxID=487698 RepID=UPI0039C71A4E
FVAAARCGGKIMSNMTGKCRPLAGNAWKGCSCRPAAGITRSCCSAYRRRTALRRQYGSELFPVPVIE